MNAVDTNVRIYMSDPRETKKRPLAGVKRLYTEDFSGYPNIDGVEIIDPFRTA